jgi:MFS family permease
VNRNQAVLGLLVLSIAINYLDRGALSVAAPLLSRELELSPSQMGLLFSAFFWSYAGFQLVAGWLVDRYPVKWVYAGGYLVWSLATAMVGLAATLPALIMARLLLGAGESVAYPACSKILARDFPEERRGFANALVDAGAKVGPGLSTLLGGLMVERFGWRALFLGVGLGSLLWLLPWVAWVKSEAPRAAAAEAASAGWRDILRRREAWGTALGMFSLGYVWYFLLSWLPSYLVKERGFSMSEMAVLGSLPFWGMAGATLAGGWTSDRWIRSGADPTRVRKAYVAGGLLLCGAAMLPAALVTDAGASVALITAACLFLGLFTSNVWAITQTLAGPLAAGKWTGIQNAIGNLGGVVSPLVTGWIVAATGSFTLAFAAATVVLLAGAAAYLSMVGEVRTISWSVAPVEKVVGL